MSEQEQWLIGLVFGPLFVGLVLGIWAARVVGSKPGGYGSLFNRAPGPKWSFDSWSTNLTAAAAGVGTVMTTAALPKHPHPVDENGLVSLSLLFGLLVVAAPFVFQSIRNPKASPEDQDAGFWGFNITLLLACVLTIAAVVGELTALSLLYWEILGGGGWGKVVVGVASAAGLVAVYYFRVTVPPLAGADWHHKRHTARERHSERTRLAFQAAFAEVPQPENRPVVVVQPVEERTSWNLL